MASLPSLGNMLPTAFFHMGNAILQWCGEGVEIVKKKTIVYHHQHFKVCFDYNLLPSSAVGLVWESSGGAGG